MLSHSARRTVIAPRSCQPPDLTCSSSQKHLQTCLFPPRPSSVLAIQNRASWRAFLFLLLLLLPSYPQGSGSGKGSRVPSSSGSEGSSATFFPLGWSPLIRTSALSTLGKSKDPWRPVPMLCKWPVASAKGNIGKRANTADISCNAPWEIPLQKVHSLLQ